MKKFIFFIPAIVVAVVVFSGLQAVSQDADNYYTIYEQWNAYYDAHPDLKLEEEGDYSQFIRWQLFWRDRVYNGDTLMNGRFTLYGKAIKEYLENRDKYDRPAPIGSCWNLLGPTNYPSWQQNGLISCVYVDTITDTTMKTIYIGTSSSGIWKTTDGGSTWKNMTDDSWLIVNGITDITGDPSNGNIIYASSGGDFMGRQGYGTGVIKSTDGGQTWQQLNPFVYDPNKMQTVFRFLVDPFNSNRMYTLSDRFLIRTLDNWSSWDTILRVSPPASKIIRRLRDIEMKSNDSSTLYVATDCFWPDWQNTNLSQIWKITNATNSDTTLIGKIPLTFLLPFPNIGDTIRTKRFELAVSRADPDAVFAACHPQDTGNLVTVWKSYDNGSTWNLKKNFYAPFTDYHRLHMVISPTDTGIVYISGLGMAKIVHWQEPVFYGYNFNDYHVDTRDVKILKGSAPSNSGNEDILFVGNDGGISKTKDGNSSWTNLNGNGLTITQFWRIGGSQNHPEIVGCGAQDNAFFKCDNGSWSHSDWGSDIWDGGECLVDFENPEVLFISRWGCGEESAGVNKSTNGGNSWKQKLENNFLSGNYFLIPIAMNPQNSRSVFAAGHDVAKSTDGGENWNLIEAPSNVESGAASTVLCLSKSDTNSFFLGYPGPLYLYTNPVKLLKRNTNDWTDLTQNINDSFNNIFDKYSITGIDVSTTDDSIWVSFGGFQQYPPSLFPRLIFSPDTGSIWYDFSQGLPDMPINCVKYWTGEGGGVFAGTDVGVFYRSFSDTAFVPFNNLLPICIVTDLEIFENDTLRKLRAATFGRGLYETDLSCHFSNDTLQIYSDQTWTDDTVLDRSISINPPATLTIRCKVSMPSLGKIYVKQGAKLIVDGGTLTNACFSNWQGIEVWGDTAKKQLPVSNQGYVQFRNNAVLENARIGITNCKKDINGHAVYSRTGGVIMAENCTFRNNYKAVEFISYPFHQICTFNNVTFKTTKDYIDVYKARPSDFVSLFAVDGIKFYGCQFTNTTTLPGSVPGKVKGQGIYSINSGFTVNYQCMENISPCPPGWQIPCTFTGLYYGIKSLVTEPTNVTRINSAKFQNNYRGVYQSGAQHSQVTSSTFFIPNYATLDTCYGLYLDHCNAYQIEENTFKPVAYSFDNLSIGLVVNSSGNQPNEIYNNKFYSMKYGILAQNYNRSSDGMTGLVLKCNDYYQVRRDKFISVEPDHSDWGIALYQGDSLSQKGPAGNTFSPQHDSLQEQFSDIKNDGAGFKYYHHLQQFPGPRVKPEYITLNVTVRPVDDYSYEKTTCCPSKLDGGIIPDENKSLLTNEASIILTKEIQLNSLLDGGNTEETNTDIYFSIPPEALTIREDLLEKSPYLSDTVMKSAIAKENVLPNEMIRDILVANPQSATSDGILDQLNERFVPMPDSMMAEILAGEEIISAKEALETELASHKQIRSEALTDLIRYYKPDSINTECEDSLIALLERENDINIKYQLAFEYLKKGDTIKLDETLNDIPVSFDLNQNQTATHENYLSYFGLLKELNSEGKNILQMDSLQLDAIHELSANGAELVKTYARNILLANGMINYFEPILLDDNLKSSKEKK